MKSLTNLIDNNTGSPARFSFILALAGIVTALLCVLAFLNDTYSTRGSILPEHAGSSSGIGEFFASASVLVSQLGNAVVLILTSF